MSDYFSELYAVDVNEKKESKNGLSYLSWAWAWAETKKRHPDATYNILKFDGRPYFYDPITGFMCYTTVTINGITHEMWLPVMDGANKAMLDAPYEYSVKNPNYKYATFDEATGKYLDRFGNEQSEYLTKTCESATMFDINKTIMRCLTKNLAMHGLGLYIYAGEDIPETPCEDCGEAITSVMRKDKTMWPVQDMILYSEKRYGRALCSKCMKAADRAEKVEAENA